MEHVAILNPESEECHVPASGTRLSVKLYCFFILPGGAVFLNRFAIGLTLVSSRRRSLHGEKPRIGYQCHTRSPFAKSGEQ